MARKVEKQQKPNPTVSANRAGALARLEARHDRLLVSDCFRTCGFPVHHAPRCTTHKPVSEALRTCGQRPASLARRHLRQSIPCEPRVPSPRPRPPAVRHPRAMWRLVALSSTSGRLPSVTEPSRRPDTGVTFQHELLLKGAALWETLGPPFFRAA